MNYYITSAMGNGTATKKDFPSWTGLSIGSRLWVLFILLSPYGAAVALRALPAPAQEWVAIALEDGVLVLLVFLAYLALRWASDRGGGGWLWRLDLLLKRLVVAFSSDRGRLWMDWARRTADHRLAKAAIEESARCGNMDGLYEWGRICKSELREDSAGAAFLGAAQQGHLEAAYEMGEATRWGRYYMRVDRADSRKWHELGARGGFVPSIRTLAIGLETGDGLDKDPEAAARWQKRLQTVNSQTETTSGISNAATLDSGFEKRSGSFACAISYMKDIVDALASRLPKASEATIGHVIPLLFWCGFTLMLLVLLLLILAGGPTAIAAVPVCLYFAWKVCYAALGAPARNRRAFNRLCRRADEG